MGGHLSHEYHYSAEIGEAKLQKCSACGSHSIDNTENDDDESECPQCHAKNVDKSRGIEVSDIQLQTLDFWIIILLLERIRPLSWGQNDTIS